jgi:hypothetical protein
MRCDKLIPPPETAPLEVASARGNAHSKAVIAARCAPARCKSRAASSCSIVVPVGTQPSVVVEVAAMESSDDKAMAVKNDIEIFFIKHL